MPLEANRHIAGAETLAETKPQHRVYDAYLPHNLDKLFVLLFHSRKRPQRLPQDFFGSNHNQDVSHAIFVDLVLYTHRLLALCIYGTNPTADLPDRTRQQSNPATFRIP
jgi:hypothetical protein